MSYTESGQYVDRTEDCWIWTGARSTARPGFVYGRFQLSRGRAVSAHRLAYQFLIGPIPEGHQLHHECQNRLCVRVHPNHVRPVRPIEHPDGGGAMNRNKTHCPRGHPYDESNTYRKNGRRSCRPCRVEAMRRYHERQRSMKAR